MKIIDKALPDVMNPEKLRAGDIGTVFTCRDDTGSYTGMVVLMKGSAHKLFLNLETGKELNVERLKNIRVRVASIELAP